jgi:anthranilate synthase component 2
MILLIDNYDSFSYNLYQMLGCINNDIKVVLNDGITVDEIEKIKPSHIVLSPGPGKPENAGICEDVIRRFGRLNRAIPILGVCLGHQAICEVYGAVITYAKNLMHGKPSNIKIDTDSLLFKGLPSEIQAARYHSLAAENVPTCLKITGRTDCGEIMAVQHNDYPICGVQFHPESILTPKGNIILENFLKI